MIKRLLEETVNKNKRKGFINIIYGPRRVGKTIFLQKLVEDKPKNDIVFFNGDTEESRNSLSSTSEVELTRLVEKYKYIAIDEAQRIPNIGLSLKILIDKFPEKEFFVTGSSSLALSRGLKEPLTGRSIKYKLYPLSTTEISVNWPDYQKPSLLENQLLFGGYPYLEQLTSKDDKKNYLKSIIDDYLFRDIEFLKNLLSPEILKKLATLLAFQIGSIVSLNELSRGLGIDVKTVANYIDLLKQGFIIFEHQSFSNNLRNELTKAKKYYFWDLGIRNALTDQFAPIEFRSDIGQLWESFLAVERKKKNEYARIQKEYYFWRNYEKAEIDWIEKEEEKLGAFEFKWKKKVSRTPKAFMEKYKVELKTINKNNYLEFIT